MPKLRLPRWLRSRRFWRWAGGAVAVLALLFTAALIDAWPALGSKPTGPRLATMEASPQWDGGRFVNPQPMTNYYGKMLASMFSGSPHAEPDGPVPIAEAPGAALDTPPESGLRVTWLGHSSMFIELDGLTVLTDPIFGGRASPVNWAGPKTWYASPIPLERFEGVDVVVISHDHYDHLQMETIQAMRSWNCAFVVPLGVGAHLEGWGIPAERISELDWWEARRFDSVAVVATPSRHASGRQVFDQHRTLWAGYAIIGPAHRAYYSGDTGLFPAMADIGRRLGPFDVTMIEVGAYNAAWPDWHLGPEQALRAHSMVRGDLFMPVHWGLMNLSTHGWTEPVERVRVEAERRGARYVVPMPGESFEPAAAPAVSQWWPELAWDTVEAAPIEATLVPPE